MMHIRVRWRSDRESMSPVRVCLTYSIIHEVTEATDIHSITTDE